MHAIIKRNYNRIINFHEFMEDLSTLKVSITYTVLGSTTY